MFGFIAFGFKLLFAAIAGGALSYIPGEEIQNHKIVETSLICILAIFRSIWNDYWSWIYCAGDIVGGPCIYYFKK